MNDGIKPELLCLDWFVSTHEGGSVCGSLSVVIRAETVPVSVREFQSRP